MTNCDGFEPEEGVTEVKGAAAAFEDYLAENPDVKLRTTDPALFDELEA